MALNTAQIENLFNHWAQTYDNSIKNADWGFEYYYDGLDWIYNQLKLRTQFSRVIDLGCGTGTLAKKLQAHFPFIEYYGFDISPKMLKIAKNKSSHASFLQLDFREFHEWGKYLDSDYPTIITSTYALHHVEDNIKLKLVDFAFSRSNNENLLILIVDFAFLNASSRKRILEKELKQGNFHIVDEIKNEYYADLSFLKRALPQNILSMSFEKNGIWDWRIVLRRSL